MSFEEFEDKGILGILDNKLHGRGQEDLCYVGFSEPTSVLDSVRSPLVSSSTTTLSSSHGALNGIATVFSGADEMGFEDIDGVLSDFVGFDTGSGSDPVIDIQNPLFDYSFPFSEEEEEVNFQIPTNSETPVDPNPSLFSVTGSKRLNSGQPSSNLNNSVQPGSTLDNSAQPGSNLSHSGKPGSNLNNSGHSPVSGSTKRHNSVQPGSTQSSPGDFSVSGPTKRLNSGQPGSNFNSPGYFPVSGSGLPSKRLNSGQLGLNHNSLGESGWNHNNSGQPGSNFHNSGQPGLNHNTLGQSGWNHNTLGQSGWNHNNSGQPGSNQEDSGYFSVTGSKRLNSGQPYSKPGYFSVTGSIPPSKRFNPGQPETNPWIFPFSDSGQPGNETVIITNELFTAAVELISNNKLLAQEILARLNHSLLNQSPNPKPPFQRAASYITEALLSLPLQDSSPLSPLQTLIPRIAAYTAFSETSPFLQFVNFTANQTILECVEGFESIHIVDFDIGFGGQWSSLIQELAKGRKKTRKALKITAFVSEKFELRFTEDNLRTFAGEVGVEFDIEFLLLNQMHCPVKEVTAVNLPISSVVSGYLPLIIRFLKEVCPKVVVCSDTSCDRNSDVPFPDGVIHALEYYMSLLESIDCNHREVVMSIERFYVQLLIKRSLTNRMERSPPWRSLFGQCGFVPVMLSRTAETQAEYLLQRSPMRGFHLEMGQSSLVLCWQKKELVTVSAWKCC